MPIPAAEIQEYFGDARRIQAFFSRRGGVEVFRSANSSDQDELVFVLHAVDQTAVQTVLQQRAQMNKHGKHIAKLNEVGVFPQGDGYWVCRLELASRFDEMLSEWHQNPLRILRLISHGLLGLMEIHKIGRFHGDLRAGNIWVRLNEDGEEESFLVGMALDLWMNPNQLEKNLNVELARYMAPERITGDPPTQATDIYAIGVLLYRGLFGKYPFDGTDAWAITAAHATEKLQKPDLEYDIDPPLWGLISSCLAKDVTDRPPTVKAILEQLQPYLQFEQMVFDAPPPSPLAPRKKQDTIQQLNEQYSVEPNSDEDLVESTDNLPSAQSEQEVSIEEEHSEVSAPATIQVNDQVAIPMIPAMVEEDSEFLSSEYESEYSEELSMEWSEGTEEEVTIVPVKVKVQAAKTATQTPVEPAVEELPPVTEELAPAEDDIFHLPEEVDNPLQFNLPEEPPASEETEKYELPAKKSPYEKRIDLDELVPPQSEKPDIEVEVDYSVDDLLTPTSRVDKIQMTVLFLVGFLGMFVLLNLLSWF